MGDVGRGLGLSPPALGAAESFFSCSRDTIFSSSSLRRASDFSRASLGLETPPSWWLFPSLSAALQQWFDLEELHPRPVLDSHEGPNIPLDNQQESLQG